MKKKCFKITILVALSIVFIFGMNAASAEDYPKSPVSMVVAYSPGGATDFQARIVTMMAGLEKYLGQPIVIINKPGAGGQVGWNWCVEKGTKDGYTMLAYNVPHFIAQSTVYKTKCDINTFEPVANWGADAAVLIVPKDSPFNTLQDLVDLCEEKPRESNGQWCRHVCRASHRAFAISKGSGCSVDLHSGKRGCSGHAICCRRKG